MHQGTGETRRNGKVGGGNHPAGSHQSFQQGKPGTRNCPEGKTLGGGGKVFPQDPHGKGFYRFFNQGSQHRGEQQNQEEDPGFHQPGRENKEQVFHICCSLDLRLELLQSFLQTGLKSHCDRADPQGKSHQGIFQNQGDGCSACHTHAQGCPEPPP